MGLFKKREKQQKQLDTHSRKLINKISKISKEKFSENSIQKLNKEVRVFLDEKYNFKRSLTIEEILKKLKPKKINKKIKLQIAYILVKTHEAQYKTKTPLEKKQFNTLTDKIKQSIRKISKLE